MSCGMVTVWDNGQAWWGNTALKRSMFTYSEHLYGHYDVEATLLNKAYIQYFHYSFPSTQRHKEHEYPNNFNFFFSWYWNFSIGLSSDIILNWAGRVTAWQIKHRAEHSSERKFLYWSFLICLNQRPSLVSMSYFWNRANLHLCHG